MLLRELLADTGSIYLHIDYKIGHYVKVLMDEVFGAKNFRNDITRIKCDPKNFRGKATATLQHQGHDPVLRQIRGGDLARGAASVIGRTDRPIVQKDRR